MSNNLNNKLAIGSDESTTAANRASRINSLVSRMFAREGLASQIKASSTMALKDDNNMVQTKLVNASSIRSSSHSIAQNNNNKVLVGGGKPAKSGKSKKTAAVFKPDATQATLKSCAKEGLSLKSTLRATIASSDEQSSSSASANVSSVPRRNLFGIRLNHDQLKQDLKDMWRDQIEQQKQRWNFDFETLRPTTAAAAHTASSTAKGLIAPSSSNDQSDRFKWTRVTYYTPGLPASSSMAPSGFDRAELFNNSQGDYEDEYESETEQEEDDALAMPQFYKYQRRLKFNDEPSRIKMMTITVSQAPARKSPTLQTAAADEVEVKKSAEIVETKAAANPMTFEPIFKMALKNSQPCTVVEKKSETSKKSNKALTIRRPKAIKRPQPNPQQPSLALSPSTQNLIITFSENRKDTLRSASCHHGNTAPVAASAAALTLTSTKVKIGAREGETAFVSTTAASTSVPASTETMKQQSLLDIFKQRKRRNTTVSSGKPDITDPTGSHKNATAAAAESRSHSVAFSRSEVADCSKAGNKLGRQSRITSSGGINAQSLRSHSSSGSKGYCKIFLRNGGGGGAKVN